MQVEQGIKKLVNQVIDAHILEEGFSGFMVQSAENDKQRRDSYVDVVTKHWKDLPESSHVAAAQTYVSLVHEQSNTARVKLLLSLLEILVEKNILQAKVVCEALLNSDQLTITSSVICCETFYLIRRIIGGVYYKGTRDLLRVILEKCQSLDTCNNIASARCLAAVLSVVSYIIDRNACLLPSYFAVNEIVKLTGTEGKSWPHWKLAELLSSFVQSFRPTAQMVSVFGRSHLLPVVGHASATGNVWKLNTNSLKFVHVGPLPYDQELQEPQVNLLRYVLEQPYSRDMVCNILSLSRASKERCTVLEEQLVNVIVHAMEESENGRGAGMGTGDTTAAVATVDDEDGGDTSNQLRWQRLSSQLIYFVLFQFTSFPHMVLALYDKLKGRGLRKGRDHLMWVLLQFISGSIQKNPLSDFLPVIKLFDLLYPEKERLPVPNVYNPSCCYRMAVTCIWIHINKKASSDNSALQRPIPRTLSAHIDFLNQFIHARNLNMSDYKIALLCNAYSTNTEYFMAPMGVLVESIYGNNQATTTLPGGVTAAAPDKPLDMSLLDCLTVHAKMSLIHSIGTKMLKLAQAQTKLALAPALVETYSRLLVYIEIESLGIKGFTTQLLPNVYKSSAWGILHTLLELLTYRQFHILPHYRVQLLGHLHYLASLPQTNQNQLHLCVESTALRLVTGLGNWEVHPQLSRITSESNRTVLVSEDSEELNRALVLTLARAMNITGTDTLPTVCCRVILGIIQKKTPHSWSAHTLASFPAVFREFFEENPVPKEDKNQLKRNVEAEYRKWKSMMGENDLITHFSDPNSQPLFLCVLLRSLMEDSRISPTAYRVLEKIGPRTLSRHLRVFADYLVYEFLNPPGQSHVAKCIESLNDMIWNCNILSIDRLVLVLALRCLEANELQVCFYIIQIALLKPQDFKQRIADFVKDNSPEHWLQRNWHEKHMAFHNKYPEKFNYEGLQDMSQQQQASQQPYLPVYFSNVCLRFLPVLDIVIHRFLEHPNVIKPLESILDHIGSLYKFHDRPITFMYHTFHYYETKLRDMPALKKKLVDKILGYLRETKPGWCVSQDFEDYLKRVDDISWTPTDDYYSKLVQRLVQTVAGKQQSPFPDCDWRFNEFSNPTAHASHVTCVELMALPVAGPDVGEALINIVLNGNSRVSRDEIMSWMNAIGLLLTTLPEPYWLVLEKTILDTLQQPPLVSGADTKAEGSQEALGGRGIFEQLNFTQSQQVMGEAPYAYVLALCHAVWQHASIGQLTALPKFLKEKVKPLVQTEEQFIYVCHLVGPFLQRFHTERTRCLLDLTIELYEMLENVDQACTHLNHMNPVTDFLYHIKYMFVGDGVKTEVEKVIRKLRPALQLRLRHIAQHGKEDSGPTQASAS